MKGTMLQAMLLAGIVAAPLGSAALFLPARRPTQNAGAWPALRRFTLAVVGTVMLAMAVAVILRVIGASSRNLSAGVTGVVYAFEWTLDSGLGAASTAGGLLLWLLEIFAALLCGAYLWEICDALGTEHWRRRMTPAAQLAVPDNELPMVSLHVPAHNEPPDSSP